MSARTARASGWRRSRSTMSAPAEHEPGLRAAEQLVAAAGHDRRAVGERARGVGLVGQQRVRPQQPAADVVDDRRPERRRAPATGTAEVKPSTRKLLGCTLRMHAGVGADRRSRSRPRWSGSSCPPRAAGRRHYAMRSGSRKPSPISTISPRLTTTSRPAASAVVASTSAAAPLLTTSAASASGSSLEQGGAGAAPAGRAPPGRQVELDVDRRRRLRPSPRRRRPTAAPGPGWCG